ncbi:MAG TPA: aminotransferase class V-fold PLP-dependent enzyme, partial [Methylomirabilota bacterium]|nr:aminotransferase class V-fold PLP-dependent enzyme [Methylomirabilota bacterium]
MLGVMRPFLEGWVGNPAARHSLGEEARDSLQAARAKVGRLVGGRAEGVVFLSGATEANNLAVKGVALRGPGRHVVTTAIEHPSL